jgi:hypothetical protein
VVTALNQVAAAAVQFTATMAALVEMVNVSFIHGEIKII